MSLLTRPAKCRICRFAYVTKGNLRLCGRCFAEYGIAWEPFRWPGRVNGSRNGNGVERALANTGGCAEVLRRYKVEVRGRFASCPFHPDSTPSMSLYERDGKSKAKCHGCQWSGDALDLEAALSERELRDVIREFA